MLIHKQWPLQIFSPHCQWNRMLSARHGVNCKKKRDNESENGKCLANINIIRSNRKLKNSIFNRANEMFFILLTLNELFKYVHFVESLSIEIDEPQQFDTGFMKTLIAIRFDNFFNQTHCNRIQFRWFDLLKIQKFRYWLGVIEFNLAREMRLDLLLSFLEYNMCGLMVQMVFWLNCDSTEFIHQQWVATTTTSNQPHITSHTQKQSFANLIQFTELLCVCLHWMPNIWIQCIRNFVSHSLCTVYHYFPNRLKTF